MTDVWTSAGVLVGVLLVALTGWQRLDPIVAFAVGVNIIVAGFRLVAESTSGLLDRTLPAEENAEIVAVLLRHTTDDVMFHGLRTRAAGRHGFATFDALVPGSWSVERAHDLVEVIEADLRAVAPDLEGTHPHRATRGPPSVRRPSRRDPHRQPGRREQRRLRRGRVARSRRLPDMRKT